MINWSGWIFGLSQPFENAIWYLVCLWLYGWMMVFLTVGWSVLKQGVGWLFRITRCNRFFAYIFIIIYIKVIGKHSAKRSFAKRIKENMSVILWLLLIVGILETFAAEWNTKDYMKREHCLIKPYQGSSISIILIFARKKFFFYWASTHNDLFIHYSIVIFYTVIHLHYGFEVTKQWIKLFFTWFFLQYYII